MDVTFSLLPDPRDYPLPPSVKEVTEYLQEVNEEGNNITIEWATNEIKTHFMAFVRVGIIAYKVKLYRLYRHAKIKTFKDYCERILGKSSWVIDRIIKAAKLTLILAQAGFTQLPQCEAQARPLTKLDEEAAIEKWRQIVNSTVPQNITANYVQNVVNGESEDSKTRITISKSIYCKLKERARKLGKTVEQLLDELLDDSHELETESEVTESEATQSEVTQSEIIEEQPQQFWLQDLEELVASYDCDHIKYQLTSNSE